MNARRPGRAEAKRDTTRPPCRFDFRGSTNTSHSNHATDRLEICRPVVFAGATQSLIQTLGNLHALLHRTTDQSNLESEADTFLFDTIPDKATALVKTMTREYAFLKRFLSLFVPSDRAL